MNAATLLAIGGLAALGYSIGSLSAGYVIGRLYRGVDLRETGSGSTGATNAMRALGPGAAAAIAILDITKGAVAVWLASAIGGGEGAQVAAALGAVAGHCWPLGLRGRGGRGMTPAVGATLVLVPLVAPIALVAFVGGIALTRIVSVGSLAAVTCTVAGYIVLAGLSVLPFDGAQLVFLGGTAAIVFVRHGANIRRLVAGTEPRLGRAPGQGDHESRSTA